MKMQLIEPMVGHDLAPKKVNYNQRTRYEFKVYITFIMYKMLLFFDLVWPEKIHILKGKSKLAF